MIQNKIHKQIVENCDAVCAWFDEKSRGLAFPIYASFDVRDSGWKVAPVDANIFPAGFNNICPTDKENAPALMKEYLDTHYPSVGKAVALLAEEHTQNAYYWENIGTIYDILLGAGYDPQICIPRDLSEPLKVKSSSGRDFTVYSAKNSHGEIHVNGKKVGLVVCNNDFSESYESWSEGLSTPMNPPRELGWYRRRKHVFFQHYNQLALEFAKLTNLDPRSLQIDTELFTDFDVDDSDKLEKLADVVDVFLAKLKQKYVAQGISTEPFCFIKNNAGTYGLAVVQVHSGEEVRDWNNKIRKKMKAAKGGREVDELIIQEGIATKLHDGNTGSAEPCIYMVGGELVGGFLRTHSEKGPHDSLNSPGAIFKRLCMSDLEVDLNGCPMENVYGWTAKLGALAIAIEARSSDVQFLKYNY